MDESPFQLVGLSSQGSAPSSSSGSQVGDGTSSLAVQGDVDGSVLAVNFGLHLSTCLKSSKSIWKAPWETSLLAHVSTPSAARPKGAMPLVRLEPLSEQGPLPQHGLLERSEGLQQVCAKMAKFKHTSWPVMLNEERNLAVNKWLRIVLVEPLAFGVARNFYKGKASGLCQGTLAESIADCVAVKATSTLHARANALIRYTAWARSKVSVVFPPVEAAVYAYFEDNQAKMGATSFKSALSAFAFAKFVLGLEGAEVIYLSGRVTGLAGRLFLAKAKLRQRNPLRCKDVKLLERICAGHEGKSKPDRVAAGFFLFLVMARARYSDGQNVSSLAINGNFLEALAARSKTSFSLERKTRFLPMAASVVGIGCDWVDVWLGLLTETGVVVDADHPTLPCPSSTGGWKQIPLPCDQACAWLRSLLRQGPHDAYIDNIGTRSCKRTLLSWASKRGLRRDTRALLGYHTSKAAGVGSELIYEADAQAAPLRALCFMLAEVKAGTFMPDNARGQEFSQPPDPVPGSPAGAELGQDDMESSSCPSADEEEVDHSGDEACLEQALEWTGKVDLHRLREVDAFFRHKQSRVIHVLCDEGGTHFGCGRPTSSQYHKCSARPKVLHPRCKQCFKKYLLPG